MTVDITDFENNVEVNTYSGYKVNERPLSFTFGGLKKKVLHVKGRWIEPDKDCFRIVADDKKNYILSWYREKGLWSVKKVSAPDPLRCVP